MAGYIFLKSLRSLEEIRKNPHVKIPPKSPSTNFQSLGKFKNPIFNSEIPFSLFSARPTLRPTRPLAQPAHWPRRPHRPKPSRPAYLAARRSRLRGNYVFFSDHAFPSRSPHPRLSVNRAPPVRITPFPAPADLGRKFPHATTAPRLGCPRAFTALPHHSPPLIPFKPSVKGPQRLQWRLSH